MLVRLRCLGPPSLSSPAGEPIRFRTRKHLALLVFMRVENKAHRRDRLAEMLWPRVSLAEARHSLATAIHILRPRLGFDGLETARDTLLIRPGRVELDLDRLAAGDVLGNEVTGPLPVGSFLDGFDIPDAPEFAHWKDRQHARLLPSVKDALVTLIDRCRRTGDTRQIEVLAGQMLELDELSEEAIRAKMEARAFAGDRVSALRLYERWKIQLADELGAEPSKILEGMAIRLRQRGWEKGPEIHVQQTRTNQWRDRPFIGRTEEYRRLYENWEATRRGQPEHLLVLGESGVGKTTLIDRFTTAACLAGASLGRVKCHEMEREISYSTLSNLTVSVSSCPGASGTPPEMLAELARTTPSLRERFHQLPQVSESRGELTGLHLAEAFCQLISAVSEESPLILVIDDIHLADDASLSVLHLAMRRCEEQAILILLAARPSALVVDSHANRIRAATLALRLSELDLRPLSEPETAQLLNTLLDREELQPTRLQRRSLLNASAGYPMVLELLVEDWRANGDRAIALSVNAMTAEMPTNSTVANTYQHLVQSMIGRLDSATQNVLNLASILGTRLNDFSAYGLADLSMGQTMAAMTELVASRFLRDGSNGLEFLNELVRGYVYVSVPSTLRRALHSKIANLLQAHKEADSPAYNLEVAWHCVRAGRWKEALPHLQVGARRALRRGSPYLAEHALASALPQMDESEKLQTTLLLIEALQEQGKWQESLEALELVHTQTDPETIDLAFVLRMTAHRLLSYFDFAEVRELAETYFEILQNSPSVRARILATVEAASILNGTHSRGEAGRFLEAIASLDASSLGRDGEALLLLAKAMLQYNMRCFELSEAHVRAAIALLEDAHAANSTLALLYSGLGAIFSLQGRYSDSLEPFTHAHQLAARTGNDRVWSQAASNLALSLARLGDYEAALLWSSKAIGDSNHHGLPFAQSSLISEVMTGRWARAQETIREYSEWAERMRSEGMVQAWMLEVADAQLLMGERKSAYKTALQATTGAFVNNQLGCCAGPFARWVSLLAVASGDYDGGRRRLNCLLSDLPAYDEKDQGEILAAQNWINVNSNYGDPTALADLERKLGNLPKGVRQLLLRLGMLGQVGTSI